MEQYTCSTCGGQFRSAVEWDRCFYCRHPDLVPSLIMEAVDVAQGVLHATPSWFSQESIRRAKEITARRDREDPVHHLATGFRLDYEEEQEDGEEKYPGWARWKRYGENWPERRQEVLERDDYQCQNCGLTQEEHIARDDLFPPGKGLHIHHKTPFREFDSVQEANRLENLVALCHTCHSKAE